METPTTQKTHDFWATIYGERGRKWSAILGTNELPIQSPVPQRAMLPGFTDALQVYMLAIDQLADGQLNTIVNYLADNFDMSRSEAIREVQANGIPILAEDVVVTIHNPQRWF